MSTVDPQTAKQIGQVQQLPTFTLHPVLRSMACVCCMCIAHEDTLILL